jgi:hypothetical protein
MAKKARGLPPLIWMPAIILGLFLVLNYLVFPTVGKQACPGSQVYCPGVGCVSGQDKCFAGSLGGPSKVFSKETFTTCPDGTRSDGPCLLEFKE